jgi:hypothetical protein
VEIDHFLQNAEKTQCLCGFFQKKLAQTSPAYYNSNCGKQIIL